MKRTGRVGYCCACVGDPADASAAHSKIGEKRATRNEERFNFSLAQGALVIAPALPRPALVFKNRLILEHR
ncbi:MAG: hypothetical protein ACREUP_09325, partial [Burkholderiales bacterium]